MNYCESGIPSTGCFQKEMEKGEMKQAEEGSPDMHLDLWEGQRLQDPAAPSCGRLGKWVPVAPSHTGVAHRTGISGLLGVPPRL